VAHLDIARHFGERLVRRGSGGLKFVGAMGADKGIPFMAHEAGTKRPLKNDTNPFRIECA
jgi:hypothetical protein